MRFSGEKLGSALALLCAVLAFAPRAHAGLQILSGCDKQLIDKQQSPGYEKTWREMIEQSPANVRWDSCFRSAELQRQTCQQLCHADSCPDRCAPPGRSNHQHVSTADVRGLPGDVKAGCEYLYKVCQAMRGQDSSLGCEIGGYGAGSHHLAVGKGIKNTAYNQCAYLKPKMGAAPDKTDQLKKEGDDLLNDLMKAAPAAAGLAKAMQGQDQGQNGATSPTPDSPALPSETTSPGSSASSDPGSSGGAGNSSGSSSNPEQISIHMPVTPPPPSMSVNGDGGAPSSITAGSGNAPDGVGNLPPGAPFTGAATTGAGSGGMMGAMASQSGSSSRAGSASAGGAAAGAGGDSGAPGDDGLNMGGGMKFGGGGGGKSSGGPAPDAPGPDDSVVKNAIDQAEGAGRDPASQASDGVGAEDGDSIFARCHAAIERCALGGCVTTR